MGNEASTSVHPDGGPRDLPACHRATGLLKMIAFAKNPRTAMMDAREHHGDLFMIESALLSEKIAGFCGPELLAAFDAHQAAGAIVRNGAFPAPIVSLLGPILPTLDGPAHAARKAAVYAAFAPAHMATYLPVIRAVVQADHAAWAARGGVLSLTVLTQKMVFKVFVAVLYGMDDHSRNDTFAALLETFIKSLSKSAKAVDAEGLAARRRLVAELIAPAVAASKARVASGAAKPCVLDVLVAGGALDDSALEAEALHVLFAGVGGVQCLAVNAITACATNPPVLHDLLAARAECLTTYGDGDARWAHLDDLGYVNRFILELKRYYVAGPTQLYGRVVEDLTIETGDGVYKIPKGCLAAAGLEATNRHPDVWTDPNLFYPSRFEAVPHGAVETSHPYAFCPHSIGKAAAGRRCAGEGLATAVLQVAIVSLFDYVWRMVPKQDYTLEAGVSTPMPLGKLMAVGFQRRSDATVVFGVAGSDADWQFLNLPEAKDLVGASASDLYDDARLDLWTRLMLKLIGKKQVLWDRPYADQVLTIPQHQRPLAKITLIQTSIEIATEDEDWPDQPWIEIQQSNFLRDHAPFVDNFDAKWKPGEDMERYVMSKVGHMWPRVNVHWNDRYSDRALQLLAFHGLGQHLVEKLPEAHDDGAYYAIQLNFMRALEVRPGFAKYGADAFFDKNGKVVKIVRHDVVVRPGDATWEYAKLCFRGSLQTKVTAVDHLLGIHATVANVMVVAIREQLPPAHPLRRLIKPFTFRSVSINYGAGRALFWPKGMLQRAYALTDKGMKQTWDFGLAHFKYETFPEHVARQQIDSLDLPFHQDGMDYWAIVHKFVSNYVDLYYKDEAAVARDADVHAFWTHLSTKLPVPMRELSLANLKDFVAHFIFLVSSMHNHLGTIAEYVSDPAFCPSAWVEGEVAGRPAYGVRLALIMTATGFTQPAITEDFSHVMLDDDAKAVCRAFTQAVTNQIAVVDARNATRVQPFQSFNPKTMEMAVSI